MPQQQPRLRREIEAPRRRRNGSLTKAMNQSVLLSWFISAGIVLFHQDLEQSGLVMLMLLTTAIFTRSSAKLIFYGLFWARYKEGGWRVGVHAELCPRVVNASLEGITAAGGYWQVAISNNTAFDLSTIFACEGGEFNVSWIGVVQVSSTIKIGNGTSVRIYGENAAPSATVTASTTGSGTSLASTSSTTNGSRSIIGANSSSSSSNTVNLEFELDRRSSDLNLPQELTSAAVRLNGSASFGSFFFVDGGELHLERVAILGGNSTNSTAKMIGVGGGIYAISSSVSVSSCVFEDNFAEYLGGGIHATFSTLTVKNSVFRGNRAGYRSLPGDDTVDGNGGGIASEYINMSIDGSLFDDNYARNKGGGVHMGNGQVSVVDSLFFNNFAGSSNSDDDEPHGEGAAFSFTVCTRSFDGLSACGVNNTAFIYNAAGKKGGSVAVGSGDSPSYIEFHRCLIHNSTTGWPFEDDPQGEGGGFSLGEGTTLVLEDCMVTDNYCGKKGSAITLSSGDNWTQPGATVIMRNSTFTGNIADVESGGVVYVADFATARFEGDGNNFTGNSCGDYGGVLFSSINTNITVEGGWFEENQANDRGGVFYVQGRLNISGGSFFRNVADEDGGVVFASEESSVTIYDGHFEENKAIDGGVIYVSEDTPLVVLGGNFTRNTGENGGGAFWTQGGANIEITGGNFTRNDADFGGFLYAESKSKTVCAGASVVGHTGVYGGAIYATEQAILDWACDLADNEALVGPAIYAREGANVTIHDAIISDNFIARGSVVFIVSSFIHTYQVSFIDTTESAELSAVQSDDESTFVAEETAFMGFQGEAVIFSEGILYLDDCDFRESPASMLVYSESASNTVVRNAALGDKNFVQETSEPSDTIVSVSLINVDLNCSELGDPCSPGSVCLEGELGVYCQCYERHYNSGERCLGGDPQDLNLSEKTSPQITYFPYLLDGQIVVSLGDDIASPNMTPTMTTLRTTNSQPSDSVVWTMSAMHHESISWTFVPSVGLLHPGTNITVRVMSLPDVYFDGNTTVTFSAKGIGAPEESSVALSSGSADAKEVVEDDDDLDVAALQNMTVIFYHCPEGSFWNLTTNDRNSTSCEVCTESAEGDTEGLLCNYPGVSLSNLPIVSGFWRAKVDSVIILECFNKEACIGGSNIESVDDYCDTGYENVYCGVCSTGYGRGSSNTCYKCTSAFKGVMYFVLVVAALIIVLVIVLLGIYLVGGRIAVSQTMWTTKSSVRMLHRRGSGIFLRSEHRTPLGIDSSASSGGEGSTNKKKSSTCVSTTTGSHDKFQGPLAGNAVAASADGHSAAEGNEGLGRGRTVTTTFESGEIESKQDDDAGAYESGGGTRKGPRGGEGRDEESTEKKKSLAVVIGEVLGSLPLSRLKIVIVVWQISSAFADITEVPFPEVYERFLTIIGISSFDLGWIMSAACITGSLDFYDELLIVTIGPMVLFGMLCVTFYLGARPARLAHRNLSSSVGARSSGVTTPSTIAGTNKRPDHKWWWDTGPVRAEGAVAQGNSVETCASLTGSSGHFALVEEDGEGSECRCRGRDGTISTSDESATLSSTAMAVAETTTESREKHVFSNLARTGSATVAVEAGASLSEGRAQTEEAEEGAKYSDSLLLESRELLTKRRSIRRIWKDGPGDDAESEQNHLWSLFARHTTMGLIILYLIYSTVSTVIFQTFECQEVEDLHTSFLRADLRIECGTPKHKAYSIYAVIMIFIYPLGIPTVFWLFLAKYRTRIDPPIDKDVDDQGSADHLVQEKEKKRKGDPTIAPTSFLWSPYYPNRYNFEVYECMRRLMLTAVLVFLAEDTVEQVAYSCLFAFISLLGFELLRPHMDRLDRMLYRTGCLVIFFTNFLALMMVTGQNSQRATVYSVGLIIVNIFFVLSIWWNTWATIKAIFSRRHVQGVVLGVDMIEEGNIETVVTTLKGRRGNRLKKAKEEVKIEDPETAHASKEDHSNEEEPVGINSSSVPESLKRQISHRRCRSASSTWAITPLEPSAAEPKANSVFDSGPRSRGFPYASTNIVTKL